MFEQIPVHSDISAWNKISRINQQAKHFLPQFAGVYKQAESYSFWVCILLVQGFQIMEKKLADFFQSWTKIIFTQLTSSFRCKGCSVFSENYETDIWVNGWNWRLKHFFKYTCFEAYSNSISGFFFLFKKIVWDVRLQVLQFFPVIFH
jgi:hypothetical protein